MATTAVYPASLPADELPLPSAFARAFRLWSEQQAGCAAAPPPSEQQHLLALLARCASASASLFSRNEDQDDLTTASMRYLLVPAMQGDVLAAAHAASPQARSAAVRRAAAAYAAFLARAGQYGLLGGPGAPARDAAEGLAAGRALDPGAARDAKVARFKRSRALAATIAQLSARQQRASAAAGGEEEEGGGECGGPGCWDEEDERQLWVMQLEAAALRALDALPLLEQELDLLRRAAEAAQQPGSSQQEQQRQQQGGASSSNSNGAQVQQAMMQRLADVASQLSLGQDRQALAQQVLRPGHILPTLTVEQQGMIELREAQQRDAREKAAAAKAAAAAADARCNSEDADEEQVAKQRAWDDFADDNPRGWGNSKLRPCA